MKNMAWIAVFVFGVFFALTSAAEKSGDQSAHAIYGPDNRQDWSEVKDYRLKRWARSTLALISSKDLELNGDSFTIKAEDYETSAGLCPGTKFGKQLTPGFCSGFLVGDDLLLTAGHCIANLEECKETFFVFDFAVTSKNENPKNLKLNKVFRCQDLISQNLTNELNYALIKLDRPTGRNYFSVRRQGQPRKMEKLTMIGHPAGLPSKISDGGEVLEVTDKIIGSVDAFGGNSGSVVLNRQTGLVEGVLVAGEPDFERSGSCLIEKICGPECKGEEIFPVSLISHLIPK